MASITSVETLSISTASLSNPCRFFDLELRVVNDTNEGVDLFQFDFYINKGTTNQDIIEFTISDLVSNVGGVKTFEKTAEVSRIVANQSPINYKVVTTTGVTLYDEDTTPLVSTWEISDLNVSTDINGVGTVSIQTEINGADSVFLGIEISVDDITYYDTNVITGLAAGTYTLYARDVYGCTKTTEFVVSTETAFEILNDFKFISLLNPVPFTSINSNRASFFNTPSYAVDSNSLSQNRKYEYLNTETLRFQFRSNYEVNKAYLINCGEVVSELSVLKLSDNLNQRDNRDARFYFEDGYLYAYYDGTGDVYDNDDNVIGLNELNGSLLFDQVQGELLSIESLGIIEILEVVTVDGLGQVMKLNYTQPVVADYLQITTYYNAENFEVYEFDLTLSQDIGDYQVVVVNNSTADFDELNPLENATFISEVISIVETFTQPNFKLVWKNSENNQMSWDTGIECFNYLPKQLEPIYEPKDENEIYTTDTTKFMLEGEVYDVFTFVFDVVSQITSRQITMISSSDYLKIDDNFYVKEETPEIEPNIGSNTYMVKLKLTLASNYNSNEREGLTRNANTVSTDGFLRIY